MMAQPTPAILVVDDDLAVLDSLTEQLKCEGYTVLASATVEGALELLRSHRFALIISDQKMPGMLGTELLAEAKRLQPHSSRILITGMLSADTVINAINQGEIFRFLAKPWLRAELLATVTNAVARYELISSNANLQMQTAQLNEQLEAKLEELGAKKKALDAANAALQTNFDHSLELCYRIINTFYPLLGQHTKQVVEICQRMVESGHFSEEEERVLIASAWLHDIGLVGFERSLLHRFFSTPESLTDDDRKLLQQHSIYGQALATFVDQLTGVGETIRAHHERFDGGGYPDGLAGEMIPRTARCLAVAVHFVECGVPKDSAMQGILRQSGTAFDPEAVRLFLRSIPSSEVPRTMREVLVEELSPGMKLATGIYSPSGLLLMGEGQELNLPTIEKIKNHNLRTSVTQRLLVYS
ncbi:MAG TPA: HD domain-containing phosphohydrolase [Chthoniobacterales bacterium]|jgi:response regulator RpfG family c-di-GMP phosphodiesterase|nr:HD domain-containing phosphohydrolase [Chthoniobacterales bacterium]